MLVTIIKTGANNVNKGEIEMMTMVKVMINVIITTMTIKVIKTRMKIKVLEILIILRTMVKTMVVTKGLMIVTTTHHDEEVVVMSATV